MCVLSSFWLIFCVKLCLCIISLFLLYFCCFLAFLCLHVTWLLHSCVQTLSSSATSRRTILLYCTVTWWRSCLTSTVLWSRCVAGRGRLRHRSTLSAATLVVKPEQPRDALGANVLMPTSEFWRTSWRPCVNFMKPNVAVSGAGRY